MEFGAIGKDVRISPLAHFAHPEFVWMGDHIAIDPFVVVTTRLDIASYIHIAPHVSIIGSMESALHMEDCTFIAAGSRIVCGSDDYADGSLVGPTIPRQFRHVKTSGIAMARFSGLGTNVVVHPGITIHEGAVVGSCSLVTHDLDPWGIYVGIPAKKIGERNKNKALRYYEELMKCASLSQA